LHATKQFFAFRRHFGQLRGSVNSTRVCAYSRHGRLNRPAGEADQIALHACQKHSGRVGRSAAVKELDPEPVRLAVVAHVRHEHTRYDRLLARGVDRHEARAMVRGETEQKLRKWEGA
jgi:hypothetical protein